MGHNPSRNEIARAEMQRAAELERANRPKLAAARHLIATWNVHIAAGWRTMFYPSVGTALFAGCPWLHVVCPACGIVGETDLRKVDIHPDASLGTVVQMMSCSRCSPHPPFAKPTGLTRRSWEGREAWRLPKYRKLDFPQSEGLPNWGWGKRSKRP